MERGAQNWRLLTCWKKATQGATILPCPVAFLFSGTVLGLGISDPIIPILLPVQGQRDKRLAKRTGSSCGRRACLGEGLAHTSRHRDLVQPRRFLPSAVLFIDCLLLPSGTQHLVTNRAINRAMDRWCSWCTALTAAQVFILLPLCLFRRS